MSRKGSGSCVTHWGTRGIAVLAGALTAQSVLAQDSSAVDAQALAEQLLERAAESEETEDSAVASEDGLSEGRRGQLAMFSALLKELSEMPEEEREVLLQSLGKLSGGRWVQANERDEAQRDEAQRGEDEAPSAETDDDTAE